MGYFGMTVIGDDGVIFTHKERGGEICILRAHLRSPARATSLFRYEGVPLRPISHTERLFRWPPPPLTGRESRWRRPSRWWAQRECYFGAALPLWS